MNPVQINPQPKNGRHSRRTTSEVKQHTPVQSIALHLLPGFLCVVVITLTGPVFKNLGLPHQMAAMLLGGLLTLTAFQLGVLLYLGKKRNGKLSLEGIVLYRHPMPWWQYLAFGLAMLLWVALIWLILVPSIDRFFIENFFSWMPDTFFIGSLQESLGQYSISMLLVMVTLQFLFVGVIGPTVEELYFRGYLLPRIAYLGAWAPAVNILLFSLYHFWSPWQNIGRILATTPLYYTVWWKRNIYLGILMHVTVNVISTFMLLVLILELSPA